MRKSRRFRNSGDMTFAPFGSTSLRWVVLSLVGVGLFATGMWVDYRRDNGPGVTIWPGDDTATAARPAGSIKTLPATSSTAVRALPKDGSLFIQLDGLGAQNVITGQSVDVRGATSPDAILSVAGVPVLVAADGRFQTVFELEPGPNFIEVVASNPEGQQTSRLVAVVSR